MSSASTGSLTFNRTGLRTYSKRVQTSSELPPNKKRRVDNSSENDNQSSAGKTSSLALEEVGESRFNIASSKSKEVEENADTDIPPLKPAPRSSIRNYFRPLAQQSNRDSSMSTFNSSDTIEAPVSISPPSSPPASSSPASTTESRKPQNKPRRRLTTRKPISFEEDISIKSNSGMADGVVKETVRDCKIGATKKKHSKGNLQQMHIDLGQNTIVPCHKCGMIFNITNPGDIKLHDKYCNAKLLPGLSEKKPKSEKEYIWKKTIGGQEHRIRVITANSNTEAKNIAMKVLDFTHEEMGGYQYELSELWSQIPNPKDPSKLVPRFKFYVYYIGSDIVGTILAEVYRDGIQIWGDQLGKEKKVVVFDRIWVDKNHRHRGYARQLADTVRRNFDSGREIPKEEVGTSELTEFGKAWATAYFGV